MTDVRKLILLTKTSCAIHTVNEREILTKRSLLAKQTSLLLRSGLWR